MRRCLVALVLAASLAGTATATASAATASDRTGAELRALARQASHDAAALAQLERIDRVDGRPVDLGRALGGAHGATLAARLRVLAQPSGTTPAGDAQRAARAVLGESRFHEQTLPTPLHGAFAWIGRKLHWIGRPASWLGSQLGVGTGWALWILGMAVALAAAVLAFLTANRRAAAAEVFQFPASEGIDPGATPAELERRAAEREQAGDYEAAVRLRFRAGLLSLDRARAIRYRPSLTSGELSRNLRSDEFDGVAHSFDEIVYGGRPAQEADARAAREGWRQVLARVRRSHGR
jgi:hypothetical protein